MLVKAPEVSRFQLVIAWDVVWQVMTVSELEAMIRWRGSLARIRDWKWVSCRRALRRAVSSGLSVGVGKVGGGKSRSSGSESDPEESVSVSGSGPGELGASQWRLGGDEVVRCWMLSFVREVFHSAHSVMEEFREGKFGSWGGESRTKNTGGRSALCRGGAWQITRPRHWVSGSRRRVPTREDTVQGRGGHMCCAGP